MKNILILLAIMIIPFNIFSITAEEIIERLEDNIVYDTSYMEGRMIINDRFGEKESSFIGYSEGDDDSLIEFTSIEEEGMKILRTENEIYLFYPEAEELIRMQGEALKDSVLGSDVSYEDMTGGKTLLDSYDVTLEGTENIDGESCYKVSMIAKKNDVPYYKQIMWIDTEIFIYRQIHRFSRSGRLLKEISAGDIRNIDGYYVSFYMVLKDTLKSNSSTEFIIDELELDIRLPRNIFSLEELTW
jgi:outer membrane lipoprotein-sorting protein